MISFNRLIAIISVLLGLTLTVIIAYLLVNIGYGYLKLKIGQEVKIGMVQKGEIKEVRNRRAIGEYLATSQKNPFGVPEKGQAGGEEKKAPEPTTLKLTLLGTIVGDQKGLGAVILDQVSKKQELYKVGDKVQGAVIASVERGKVLLKLGEKEQVLLFEEPSKASPPQASPPKQSQPQAPTTTQIQIQRADLEAQLQDLPKLMSQVNVAPHFKDGQPAGIGIHRITPGSIFQRMGLQNGDILVGVEGNPISSPEELINLYDKLKNAESLRLQVERGGSVKEIEYTIN